MILLDGSFEIRRSPVEVGSDYPSYLPGFSTIPGGFSRRISDPSTVLFPEEWSNPSVLVIDD